ncbi:ABC transporter ATP-binding protein [Roseomonas sp. PWR1]|uniref:ABC transporter ATP-binding protein n=1 Tax=Roseomonas nitratireducens TaxID=2820810 RepID=A0ABS4AMI2_9PROT|nr:ABC transporter ATP-binding protein [Neoroseomonas nitratireducens]
MSVPAVAREPAISVQDLKKTYKIYRKSSDVLGELFGRQPVVDHVHALNGISFDVGKGEILGVLGRNGAGKSTLLKLLTGVIDPTGGSITIRGRISQVLELGTGFSAEATGRENIFLGGLCLGMSRAEITERVDEIIAFSELGEFIDRPFRTYSLGMQARLSFAVAFAMRPEVLIIDEWLAVGDAKFGVKCYDRIREFKREGTTIVFVTHNYSTVTEFCDQTMIIDKGAIHFIGAPEEAVFRYSQLLFGAQAAERPAPAAQVATQGDSQDIDRVLATLPHDFSSRFGDGQARVAAVSVESNGALTTVLRSGDKFALRIFIDVLADIEEMIMGFYIKDRTGRSVVLVTNVLFPDTLQIKNLRAGTRLEATFDATVTLSAGYFFLGIALARPDAMKLDQVDRIHMIEVIGSPQVLAESIVNVFPTLRINGAATASKP